MTIFELLKVNSLYKLEVINKNADLSRKVETIESTETPDVVSYLPKNTLLITTAMAYKNNQEQLCKLIYKLNDLPCAALAIKLGRFIDELDKEVIMTADRLGFPLLQIPMNVTLGEIYHNLLAYLWNIQNKEILYALNTQKKFSTLIFNGASTEILLNNLGIILKKPVLIMDPIGNIIATNDNFTEQNKKIVKKLFFSRSLYKDHSGVMQYYIDQKRKKGKISTYFFNSFDRNSYCLFIFNSESLSDDSSTLVIEQVLLAFEFSLYKNLCISYNELKHDEQYLVSLLNKYQEENLFSQEALSEGNKEKQELKTTKFYYIILVALETFKNKKFRVSNLSYREQKYIFIYKWLKKDLSQNYNNKVTLLPQTENYTYVLLIRGDINDLEEKLRYYHDRLWDMLQVRVSFSYGNKVSAMESIKYSYLGALESYKNGEKKNDISFIKYFKTKNVKELLKTLSKDQVEGFCIYNLKILAYPQDIKTMELRNTLKVYLESKCNITETSNKMFIHRNTVKYRIKKCENILGQEIENSDFILRLQLSLILTEENNVSNNNET